MSFSFVGSKTKTRRRRRRWVLKITIIDIDVGGNKVGSGRIGSELGNTSDAQPSTEDSGRDVEGEQHSSGEAFDTADSTLTAVAGFGVKVMVAMGLDPNLGSFLGGTDPIFILFYFF